MRRALRLMGGLVYEGRPIRVVETDQGSEWVASDVCACLGIANAGEAARGLVPGSEKRKRLVETIGGPQRLLTLTRLGVYRLAFKSRKVRAMRFSAWLIDIDPDTNLVDQSWMGSEMKRKGLLRKWGVA